MTHPYPITAEKALFQAHLEQICPEPTPMEPACALAFDAHFGGIPAWLHACANAWAEAPAQAGAPPKGVAWAVTVFDPRKGALQTRSWCDLGEELLLEDVIVALPGLLSPPPEQAEASEATGPRSCLRFWAQHMDWARVYKKYTQAIFRHSQGLGCQAQALVGAQVLDVRRKAVYEAQPQGLPGARWLDPAHIQSWGKTLPPAQRYVLSCVWGHEVSRAAALQLRAWGLDACFLEGGLRGWEDLASGNTP